MTQDVTSFRILNAQSIHLTDLPDYLNPLAGFQVAKQKLTIRHAVDFSRLVNPSPLLRGGLY